MEGYMKEDMHSETGIAPHLTDIIFNVIDDELDTAKQYILAAVSHKSLNSSLANDLCNASAQELQHAEIFSNHVEAQVSKLQASDGVCYKTMKEVWEHAKKRQQKYAAWIRLLHAQYKK